MNGLRLFDDVISPFGKPRAVDDSALCDVDEMHSKEMLLDILYVRIGERPFQSRTDRPLDLGGPSVIEMAGGDWT